MKKSYTHDVKIIVVGAGHWGSRILHHLQKQNALYAYVDEYREHEGVPRLSLKEALESPADAFMIATPSHTHAEIAKQALQAQKHVFIEKPFCLSLEEANSIIALANTQKRTLMIGYLMMFHPITDWIRQLSSEKKIDRILIQRQDWTAPRQHESVCWDLTVHDVSMLFAIFGQLPILEKSSKHATGLGLDHFFYQGRIPQGPEVMINTSWRSPVKQASWVLTSGQESWRFCTQQGEFQVLHQKSPHSEASVISLENRYPLEEECRHFIDCILGKTQAKTDASSTHAIMQWLDHLHQTAITS